MRAKNFPVLVAAWLAFTSADAAEVKVKVIGSVGRKAMLERVASDFERATSHEGSLVVGTAAALKRQIEGGERFHVAVGSPPRVEDLARQGKFVPDTLTNVVFSIVECW